eukprot:m.545560 g.545560  ORF g.545560 m.545560 type:complete len:61 (-) comp22147_c0_seq17:1250-1432(-)
MGCMQQQCVPCVYNRPHSTAEKSRTMGNVSLNAMMYYARVHSALQFTFSSPRRLVRLGST